MEDKKDTVSKTDSSSEKRQESKKFLVFYVIGLFCVALALILLSYVSQVRADRRLNELSSSADDADKCSRGRKCTVTGITALCGGTGKSTE